MYFSYRTNLLCIEVWILSFLIVDLMITGFTETAGVVRLIIVNARNSSLNTAFVIVACMTHIFSPMLPIIMIAHANLIQLFENFYQLRVILLFHLKFQLTIILFKKLIKEFLFFCSNCFFRLTYLNPIIFYCLLLKF